MNSCDACRISQDPLESSKTHESVHPYVMSYTYIPMVCNMYRSLTYIAAIYAYTYTYYIGICVPCVGYTYTDASVSYLCRRKRDEDGDYDARV